MTVLSSQTEGNSGPVMADGELEGQTFAAVDLGSNSFHLIVARYEHGQLQLIDRLREMVRLAEKMDEEGRVADEARDRALECLARFGERLRGIPLEQVRALATNTLRRSRDPRAFLLSAEAALGHPVEVISGHEEARLIYVGVSHDIAAGETKRLVVDIDGGSTELIVGSNERPELIETLSAGCVTVSERFFADRKITRSALKAAETAVALELRPIRSIYHNSGWNEAIGSSDSTSRRAGDSGIRLADPTNDPQWPKETAACARECWQGVPAGSARAC